MSEDRPIREARYRAAMWEQASQALTRIGDDEIREQCKKQLHSQGGSRVVGAVATDGDPDSLTIRIDVLVAGQWVTLVRFHHSDIGMTDEDVAEEIKLLRWQSGVDIPDDISSIDHPDM